MSGDIEKSDGGHIPSLVSPPTTLNQEGKSLAIGIFACAKLFSAQNHT